MNFSSIKRVSTLVAVLIAAPLLCRPAAIEANGTTCEVGNCASPGTLNPGDTLGPTNFSFNYTFANTDTFHVTGTYSASGTAPSIAFSAVATYIGNSTSTPSAADTLSVDLLQYFGYMGSPDGTYSESATLSQTNVAAGSSVTAELFFDGQGIGLLGPYTGNGSQTFSSSAALTGLSNPSLADFNYTFNLAAGSPAIPEPGSAGLLALGLLGVAVPMWRRRRAKSVQS